MKWASVSVMEGRWESGHKLRMQSLSLIFVVGLYVSSFLVVDIFVNKQYFPLKYCFLEDDLKKNHLISDC